MNTLRRLLLALPAAAVLTVTAATGPYDEAADAKAEIRAALTTAKTTKQPVLVVFGANWCADCKVLDLAFKQGEVAPLITKNFRVVKVNVGRFNVNTDIAEGYGVPLKQGIPAVAVLAPDGHVLHATTGGELADARSMGERAIADYFQRVAAGASR